MQEVAPEGKRVDGIDGEVFIDAFRKCFEFIGTDASRTWGMGAMMQGSTVLDTNNGIISTMHV